ncbi:MAG: electron transfer flavoprotein subunit alpha/FixB family protein [Bacteroidota bacterium]
MSVLIFVELNNGSVKKSAIEAVFYGSELAKKMNTSAQAVVLGEANRSELANLGNYGVKKVQHVSDTRLNQETIVAYSKVISQIVEKEAVEVVIFAKSSLGDAVAARVGGKFKAAIVANAVDLPDTSNGFKVKRSIYTGKAFAYTEMISPIKVITIKKNAVIPVESNNQAEVLSFSPDLSDSDFEVKLIATHKASGGVSLPEADLVVSAGRGLKGPENWGIVEDLAKALGAATACSKPVSDLDWRPHHEHVGQTGIKVSPNLYIACGISGAIQHLAGVNSSKVIVVINKDPEAPFFKAADYGIVGDVFDILPRLTKAVLANN